MRRILRPRLRPNCRSPVALRHYYRCDWNRPLGHCRPLRRRCARGHQGRLAHHSP
ncbi:hypothetical protein F9K88_16320 [Brucella intermedia]|nr:hypothetical protein F9K77_08690 [Ochrobactrum sp. LMG 5442]KAB2707502.1 hypothetical protein F9K80_18345 [Brucella intermedia]HCH72423.1 hypothetical protein [Ochrobactrum sp.]KAB2709140.1 hypothetical protein F9K88_16320 [Brucella intermedia]MPR61504.1 hypothetical protein [Brucella intermedia]